MTRPRSRNVRKLLARLYPKVARLQPGGGGVPVETAIDIAAAAGLAGHGSAPHQLAVLTLCLRWWPGMFEGPLQVVGRRVIHHKLVRYDRRAEATVVEKIREELPIEAPSETAAFRRIVSLIEHCLHSRILDDFERHDANLTDALKAELHYLPRPKPRRTHAPRAVDERVLQRVSDPRFLGRWARAVIHEYRYPNHCQSCQVFGQAGMVPVFRKDEKGNIEGVDYVACEACMGQGVVAWSAHRRAEALTISVHTFRNQLKPYHEGALALLRTLEERGAGLLLRFLG